MSSWISEKSIEQHNDDVQKTVAAIRHAHPDANLIPLHLPYRDENGIVQCTCGPNCKVPGKHPRYGGWQDAFYVEEKNSGDFLPQNWEANGKVVLEGVSPNIGLEPGSIGLVAVDLDTYKKDYEGNEIALPENTIFQVTGNGGKHLLYKLPKNVKVGSCTGSLPKGIDIRSTGGYIVHDPSLHYSGNHYEMSDWLDLDKILDIPTELLDTLIEANKKSASHKDYSRNINTEAPEKLPVDRYQVIKNQQIQDWILNGYESEKGERSEIDYKVCCSLASYNFTADQAYSTFYHYPVGTKGKFSTAGDDYLLRTINKAFAFVEANRKQKATEQDKSLPIVVTSRNSGEREAAYIERVLKTYTIQQVLTPYKANGADKTLFESLWYNLDEKRTYIGEEPLYESYEDLIFALFQTQDRSPSEKTITLRIKEISFRNCQAPLLDYFNNLVWDGTPRLKNFARMYLQDDDTVVQYEDGTVEYLRCVYFPKWMVGTVAKLFTEGKFQNPALVLAGKQAIGKSSLAKWFASGISKQYYTEGSLNPDKNEDKFLASTKFIWELSELGATVRRADIEALKSFMTNEFFDIRLAWAKKIERFPHRASYIATVNDGAAFLNDPTGNRRYLVLNMESINWDYINEDVDQLFAEAVYLFKNGFDCRLTEEEIKVRDEQNEMHNIPNVMEEYIAKYCFTNLPGNYFTSSTELTEAFIGLPLCKGKTERVLQNDISTAMTKQGIRKTRGRIKVDDPEGGKVEKQVWGYAGVKVNAPALNAALAASVIKEQELPNQ